MAIKLAAIAALSLVPASMAVAQTESPGASSRQAAPLANPSVHALIRGINDPSHRASIDIRKLDLNVRLRGGIAETVMEMQLFAPPGQITPLEGRIHLNLPAGSIVTGYALDVNGGMVDASLVDQSTARAAYEQQVRKLVDPGLGEVDLVGGFNTRIFPIDAAKGRRLRLRFVTPLTGEYQLPLNVGPVRDGWTITVEEPGVRSTTQVQLGHEKVDAALGRSSLRGTVKVNAILRIAQPRAQDALASMHSTGEAYWQLAGSLPQAPLATGGTLRIYWDRSRSRRDHDHGTELAQINRAVEQLRPERIEWVAFSSGTPQRATVPGMDGVKKLASALRYRGATTFTGLVHDAPAQTCVLVSDGRSTLDTGPLPVLPCRLFSIVSPGSDVARLTRLAQATGGRAIDAAASNIDWRATGVTAITDERGQRLDFVNLPLNASQWRVALRAPASGAVRVQIGDRNETRWAPTAATRFDGEATLLAASDLAGLDPVIERQKFTALSRRYSLASPTLAFTVLERPEDYVANKIEPSSTYTRRAEWVQLAAEAAEDEAEGKAKRIETVLKDWRGQVAWWEKKFDIDARPASRDEMKATAMPGAPPPPPPPPAPPPAPVGAPSGSPAAARAANANGSAGPSDIQIAVAAWRPDRDYLNAYDAAPQSFDAFFPEWDRKAGDVPSFYLDTADWLWRRDRKIAAIEMLLSALDLATANETTVGMVASRLERWGELDLAVALRERHAILDPSHPQPRRLLALTLGRRAALGGPNSSADLKRAIKLLGDIAMSPLDIRWRGIDMISLTEANALLARLHSTGGTAEFDPRFVRNLASDVRIVLDWSNDAADIDLWVDEPNGERAIYSNNRTLIGGHLSDDMTSGFGPEAYFLRRAAGGRYTVRANVFASDRLDPNGTSRVTAHLFRDWGRPNEREDSIDLDLKRGQKGEVRIGTLKVAPRTKAGGSADTKRRLERQRPTKR